MLKQTWCTSDLFFIVNSILLMRERSQCGILWYWIMKSTNETYLFWSKRLVLLKLVAMECFFVLTICKLSVYGPDRLKLIVLNLKFWQKSLTDLITSGFFCIREFAGLVYINHSSEKSARFSSLLNSRGNVASLFSWTCSFLMFAMAPNFSGKQIS